MARIDLPDDLFDIYEKHAQKQGRPVQVVVIAQLERFQQVPPGKRHVVLGVDVLTALESTLHGLGEIRDGQDLLARVQRMGKLSFEGVDLRMTPAQLEEIQLRAARGNKTVSELVQEVAAGLSAQFFHAVGSGTPKVAPIKIEEPIPVTLSRTSAQQAIFDAVGQELSAEDANAAVSKAFARLRAVPPEDWPGMQLTISEAAEAALAEGAAAAVVPPAPVPPPVPKPAPRPPAGRTPAKVVTPPSADPRAKATTLSDEK